MRTPFIDFGLVAPLALTALCFRKARNRLGLFLPPLLGCTFMLTLFVTAGRYRVTMLPAVLVFAAAGIELLFLRARSVLRRTRPVTTLFPLLLVLAAWSLVVNLPAAPGMPAAGREALIDSATAAYRGGNFPLAERLARRAVREDARAGKAWQLLGILAGDRGDFAEAVRCYRRALRTLPGDPETRVNLAIALSEAGDKRTARRMLLDILKNDPRCADAWYNLGVEEQARGDRNRALAAYRQAIWARPGLASAHLNRGLLLQQAGDIAAALRELRITLRIAPRKINAMNALAFLLAERGEREKAVAWFEKSLSADPRQPLVRRAYADYLDSLGDHAAAAIVRRPANPAKGRVDSPK